MRKWVAAAGMTLLTLGGVLYWTLQSSWLSQEIERRVVEELKTTTGAAVTLSEFTFDWRRLQFHTGPVILRGTEGLDREPLLHLERLDVGMALDLASRLPLRVVSVEVLRPVISIYVAPDGSTNLPAMTKDRPLPEALADVELRRLEIREGELRWNDRRIPIDLRASDVAARVEFAAIAREYRGFVSAGRIEGAPLSISARADFGLSASRLNVTAATVRSEKSSAVVSGEVTNWQSPKAIFEAKVEGDLQEWAQTSGWKELQGGVASATLQVEIDSDGSWRIAGPARASNVVARLGGEVFRGVSADATLNVSPDGARFEDLVARGLGGEFRGSAAVQSWRRFQMEGNVRGVELPGGLSAQVTGSIRANGTFEKLETAAARLQLTPSRGPVPVGGSLDAEYASGDIVVRHSELLLGNSQVNLSGALQQGVVLRLRTNDANELLPALRLLSDAFPEEMPFSLEGQPAEFSGTLLGPVSRLHVAGRVTAARIRVSGHAIDHLRAEVDVGASALTIRRASFERNGAKAVVAGQAAMQDWRISDESVVDGTVELERADIATLAKEFGGEPVSVSGMASGTATIRGTFGDPRLSGSVRATRGEVAGEAFDTVEATFDASRDRVEVSTFEAARAGGRVRGAGEWTQSAASFSIRADQWDVSHRANVGEPLIASGRATGSLQTVNGRWQPSKLDASAQVRAKTSGALIVNASTQGGDLKVSGRADIFGAGIAIDSSWRMEPGLPGGGTIKILSLTQTTIERAAGLSGDSQLPFEAQVEGGGSFSGKLLEPERLAAQLQLSLMRITPRQRELAGGFTTADLTLRNQGPVLLAAGPTGIVIQHAKFTAKETEVDASGNVAFRKTDQMNFLLRGRVNLAVLDAFNPDIAAVGQSSLNLRVRGPVKAPRLDGRLAFENASFNLRGFPNGLDSVNGAVIFDRNRASVDGLRGQSGGGAVVLNGYVGFGAELSYQLQMAFNQVRVRYPEGVSTQANASLILTGTSRRSLLSGSVTLLRAGLTPSTDVGGLLVAPASSLQSSAGPADFRRGLQLDLRVETAQSAQFTTELTKNLEADVDVRVRGTALRPVVLGRVSVTQGSIQFFGTDYTINRGEVNFINPVTVEPQVDLDLETRVRGILVSISFAGPLNRMSMSYRSDPPLQSSEILALLAVGRTPTSATTLGFSSVRGNNLLSAGGTAVLSSALSQGSPSSGQLQRFFGVTRLKIDPQLIGLDNTPQSRLSFEQPISRDVTVTYSQTLARAQGQLVRVQWDLNRQWSALATRDENGILAIDFVFRKSFR